MIFERLYIYFQALKKGFKEGCRKILWLDGCHLKANQRGQILTMVMIDANNGIYPIAFSVFEAECKDSWIWFLENIKEDFALDENSPIT